MNKWEIKQNKNNNIKKVFISGVTGQDGSNMCDFLLNRKDIKIFGGVRRVSVKNYKNIEHLKGKIELVNFDLSDSHSIREVVEKIQPDYFINFAAQSFVKSSWDFPVQTMIDNSISIIHILEAIKSYAPKCRFYNAGSSEEFGDVITDTQDEDHPLRPQSPYGASKCAARHLVRVYRESYNLHAIQGWLFNHEGTRRGTEFVTRKISKSIARFVWQIENDQNPESFELGNLDALRDWTDSVDFMEGVWLMLNQKGTPKEYVLASGKTYSVREFLEQTLSCANIKFVKSGEGIEEKYFTEDGRLIVSISSEYYRNAEVYLLCGNPKKAEKDLNWARKTGFKKLVAKMFNSDYSFFKKKCI